jgi:3-hydroxyphenylacetate 6-hydroxylase
VETYIPHLDLETKVFIKELLKYGKAGANPINPASLVQRLSLSMAFTINWGTKITNHNDEMFLEIAHVENEISRFRSTTDNLQDYIPLLRLIPFSSGKRKAAEYRERRDRYLTKLNKELAERIKDGTHSPCIQANVILDKEAKLNNVELTSISLTMLSAGFETTSAVMVWAICILATRKDIQDKAIFEIRKLYGHSNPMCDAFEDQKCKYIVALLRECLRYLRQSSLNLGPYPVNNFLRYFTVLRLSVPRSTIKDFIYEGKRVPVGTTLFLNAWACNMGN